LEVGEDLIIIEIGDEIVVHRLGQKVEEWRK
jgi:hypothetical protein